MGSVGIAAWIAHGAFWTLVVFGLSSGELTLRRLVVLLSFWLAGLFGLPYFPYGAALFSPYVAVLDIVLVFMIFKGDVRL
jgi:hypothetical protein